MEIQMVATFRFRTRDQGASAESAGIRHPAAVWPGDVVSRRIPESSRHCEASFRCCEPVEEDSMFEREDISPQANERAEC